MVATAYQIGYGDGDGYGDGSGYGCGYGYGHGHGDGDGYGHGDGDGDGYGYGNGVFIIDIESPILAYHYFNPHCQHAGCATPTVGDVFACDPPLKICWYGLHASINEADAKKYAKPGAIKTRVECWGEMIFAEDKLCCQYRRVIEVLPC